MTKKRIIRWGSERMMKSPVMVNSLGREGRRERERLRKKERGREGERADRQRRTVFTWVISQQSGFNESTYAETLRARRSHLASTCIRAIQRSRFRVTAVCEWERGLWDCCSAIFTTRFVITITLTQLHKHTASERRILINISTNQGFHGDEVKLCINEVSVTQVHLLNVGKLMNQTSTSVESEITHFSVTHIVIHKMFVSHL